MQEHPHNLRFSALSCRIISCFILSHHYCYERAWHRWNAILQCKTGRIEAQWNRTRKESAEEYRTGQDRTGHAGDLGIQLYVPQLRESFYCHLPSPSFFLPSVPLLCHRFYCSISAAYLVTKQSCLQANLFVSHRWSIKTWEEGIR